MVLVKSKTKALIIFLIISTFVLISNTFVMNTSILATPTQTIALGSVIDLLIILPICFYLLIIRSYKLPSLSILPVIFLCFVLAYFIIPQNIFPFYTQLTYVIYGIEGLFILIELTIAVFFLKKLPTFMTAFRKNEEQSYYFLPTFHQTAKQIFGNKKFLGVIATDISIFYYSIFNRKKKSKIQIHTEVYTYHKNTGYFGLVIILLHALAFEMIAIHMLLAYFVHPILAWVLTVLDFYFLLAVIADYRAVTRSPIVLDKKGIHFQKGIRSFLMIRYEDIEEIQPYVNKDQKIDKKDAYVMNLPEVMGESIPQFEIKLNKILNSTELFGKQKEIRRVYVSVDEKHLFKEKLQEKVKLDDNRQRKN